MLDFTYLEKRIDARIPIGIKAQLIEIFGINNNSKFYWTWFFIKLIIMNQLIQAFIRPNTMIINDVNILSILISIIWIIEILWLILFLMLYLVEKKEPNPEIFFKVITGDYILQKTEYSTFLIDVIIFNILYQGLNYFWLPIMILVTRIITWIVHENAIIKLEQLIEILNTKSRNG